MLSRRFHKMSRKPLTNHDVSNAIASGLHSRGAQFECRPENRLPLLTFRGFFPRDLPVVKASDARRITAAEMKYMRRTAGYTWRNYKTNAQIAKELKITPILDKLLEYKRSWIQHVNRMPRNRLPRVVKYYSPTGRRNHGRALKRLLNTSERNGSISGPAP